VVPAPDGVLSSLGGRGFAISLDTSVGALQPSDCPDSVLPAGIGKERARIRRSLVRQGFSPKVAKRSAMLGWIALAAAKSALPSACRPLRNFASPRPYREATSLGASTSAAS
jgi:hypothetical protein